MERDIGSCSLLLLVSLLVAGTIVLEKLIPPKICTVGLSGILFGILTWRALRIESFSDAAVLVFFYLFSSAFVSNVSILGHVHGVIAGALLWFALGDKILC